MKKLLFLFVLQLLITLSLSAQSVAEYTYKLDNGIVVKTERCWNHVWVQQDYVALQGGDQTPLTVTTRTLGDLTAGSTYKLMRAGKEVKMKGAAPGTYDLKLAFKLSGKPGTLSFLVNNVVIKQKSKTTITITLYDYQVLIGETPGSLNGLSFFETKITKFKGNSDQSNNMGIPIFYAKGSHDKAIAPDESTNKTSGKIKPGIYDVLISISISGQTQKVWLENFTLKPNVNYSISTNLNGGIIVYSGGNKDIKNLHLYPAGTAATQPGTASPIKNLELGNYDNVTTNNACPPGSYDVLLASSNGNKFEWRKNFVIKTGSKTEIR